jgi:hypothetical protein
VQYRLHLLLFFQVGLVIILKYLLVVTVLCLRSLSERIELHGFGWSRWQLEKFVPNIHVRYTSYFVGIF